MTTLTEQKLTKLVDPILTDEGLELVQLTLLGEGRGCVLQILVDNPVTGTMDLNTCARLSRTIGTHLEVEDAIKGAYRLEISSPGIDRPLVKPAHYIRFIGFEAKIDTHVPINDQKRYHGRIIGADNDTVTIETDTKTVTLAYADIARAKLKLTDDLIKMQTPKAASATTETPA